VYIEFWSVYRTGSAQVTYMLIYRSDVVGNAQKVQRWSIRGCTDGVRRRTGYYRDVQVVDEEVPVKFLLEGYNSTVCTK
jgi:hypothetical protein